MLGCHLVLPCPIVTVNRPNCNSGPRTDPLPRKKYCPATGRMGPSDANPFRITSATKSYFAQKSFLRWPLIEARKCRCSHCSSTQSKPKAISLQSSPRAITAFLLPLPNPTSSPLGQFQRHSLIDTPTKLSENPAWDSLPLWSDLIPLYAFPGQFHPWPWMGCAHHLISKV